MNKWLLGWNIVLTIVVALLVLGGCSSNESQISYLTNQVQADKAAIAQLEATVNQHTQQIQTQAAQMAAIQTAMQAMVPAIQQYVQQYVQQAIGK